MSFLVHLGNQTSPVHLYSVQSFPDVNDLSRRVGELDGGSGNGDVMEYLLVGVDGVSDCLQFGVDSNEYEFKTWMHQ